MISEAFTLVELLAVVAIIALLAGLLLLGLGRAKHLSRRTACLSNLYQFGLGTTIYLNDHGNRMPWVSDEDLQLTPPVTSALARSKQAPHCLATTGGAHTSKLHSPFRTTGSASPLDRIPSTAILSEPIMKSRCGAP